MSKQRIFKLLSELTKETEKYTLSLDPKLIDETIKKIREFPGVDAQRRLYCIPEQLVENEDIWYELLCSNENMLSYIPKVLKNNKEFYLRYYKNNPKRSSGFYHYFFDINLTDKELIKKVIKHNTDIFRRIDSEILNDELIKELININPNIYKILPEEYRLKIDIMQVYINANIKT